MLKNINRLIDNVRLVKDKDYLGFKAIDRSAIIGFDFKLNKTEFEAWNDTNTEIQIDLKDLLDSLKVNETNTIEFQEDKILVSNKFQYTINQKEFFEEEMPPMSELDYTDGVELELDYKVLREVFKEFNKFGDGIEFVFDNVKKKLELTTKTIKKELTPKIVKPQTIKVSKYPIDYLRNLFFYAIKDQIVNIKFKTEYPIRIEFDDYLMCLLAPRITED